MGFSRQGYWSGLPFPPSVDFPNPGIKPTSLASPALAREFFDHCDLESPKRLFTESCCFSVQPAIYWWECRVHHSTVVFRLSCYNCLHSRLKHFHRGERTISFEKEASGVEFWECSKTLFFHIMLSWVELLFLLWDFYVFMTNCHKQTNA